MRYMVGIPSQKVKLQQKKTQFTFMSLFFKHTNLSAKQ